MKGEGIVTAADITHDSDVEILNPDLHIATLAKNASFPYAYVLQSRGRGYTSS